MRNSLLQSIVKMNGFDLIYRENKQEIGLMRYRESGSMQSIVYEWMIK